MREFRVIYCGTYSAICFVVLFCSRLAQVSGDVFVVGNVDGTSDNSLPLSGTTYLLHPINQTGILFAISAYFVNRTNASFQIWRPTDGSSSATKSFKLIWQLTATPSIAQSREDIYMEAKFLSTCALVRPGDWLGFVLLTYPGAIGAQFAAEFVLMPKMNKATGLTATFDMTNNYPYRLLLATYFYTDPALLSASALQNTETTLCPTGLLIPSWINSISSTTVSMVTYPLGAIGATGATGATGQMGQNGSTGYPGFQGITGETGPMGKIGLEGMQGRPGPIGSTGQRGEHGRKGPLGLSGPSGPMGILGDTGEPGPPGPPGIDVYQYAIQPEAQQVLSDDDLQSDGGLADRAEMRMGAIIWLALLSGIVVLCAIMLIFVCYFVADDRRVQKNEAAWMVAEVNNRR